MIKKYTFGIALLFAALLGGEAVSQTYTWSPAGPVLTAGRSRNMVVDRNNNNFLYVGSVSSGIFTSTNGGLTWNPLNDQDTVRNISYLAQAANGKIYAATGEGFLRPTARARAITGTGLYEVSGTNLVQVQNAAAVGTVITRVACHPSDPNKIAVAGNKGLMISTDGGANFIKASGDIAPSATALTVHYTNAGDIYVTTTSVTTGGLHQVYKSVGGDPTLFTNITPTSNLLPNINYGRIELAIANSNNATIYASIAKSTNPSSNNSSAALYAFFVSKDAGNTWTLILEGSPQLDPLSNGGSINSGDYAHCLKVNPYNEDQVFYGGYKFYTWTKTAGGPEGVGTWQRYGSEFLINTPLYLRQNIHDIQVTTSGNSISNIFFITDGGIYRSSDYLLTFQPFFNGLNTAQYNSISIARFPKTGNNGGILNPYSGYIAGTGGNGISYFSGNYPLVSNELNYLADDFFQVQYSRVNPNTAFFAAANSNLYVAADVTANDPTLMQVSHLGTKCSNEPSINQIDYRGITNGGSTTDAAYSNTSFTAVGTPFKLWENDHVNPSVDSALFFNDSVLVLIPLTDTSNAISSFTVSLVKPQKNAILDKVVIRTFTIAVPNANSSQCFNFPPANTFTQSQKAAIEFNGASSPTTLPSGIILSGLTSPTANASNTLHIDAAELKDEILFEMTNPLSLNSHTAAPTYVRVGVTAFYRYDSGSKIYVTNENIQGKPYRDSLVLASNLAWTFNDVGTSSLTPVSTSAPFEFALPNNTRLAILNTKGVLVSKRPLNVNDPQKFQVVSCSGALSTSSSTYNAGPINVEGVPYLLEWAPNGKALYYVTEKAAATPTYYVYKVNM
ncbi:MAG: hypothetical protein AB7O73_06940, partial [Bacteroidia bacterium]